MSKLASVCHSNLIYVVEKNNTAAPSWLLRKATSKEMVTISFYIIK